MTPPEFCRLVGKTAPPKNRFVSHAKLPFLLLPIEPWSKEGASIIGLLTTLQCHAGSSKNSPNNFINYWEPIKTYKINIQTRGKYALNFNTWVRRIYGIQYTGQYYQTTCLLLFLCMHDSKNFWWSSKACNISISRSVKPNDKKWQQRIHCCKLIEHKLCHTIVVNCDPKHKKMVPISIVTHAIATN